MGDESAVVESLDDIIKILVATDIHLGCNEKDSVRGEDSFIAFEEILELAVSNDVDFILLGGDLFHDASPSQNALNKCLRLLRQYTLGDKPIEIEFLSDQSLNFLDSLNQTVNYEDPNLNVSIPVFSIHGNHDDPSGFGRLSSLDILSSSGLINYFGKWVDLQKIEINPIMIKKGETQLAMYGLSHIHDARLARLFIDAKVVMEKPDEKTGVWFNLMVLHQNRADRGPKNFLPENLLPEFLDLVIWGHEHDCRIWPEENSAKNFYVSQPGSSVATSLSEGEAIDKHCGLLQIYKNKFNMQELPLKTVRPFIFDSINLADYADEYDLNDGDATEKVMEIAKDKITEMLERAKLKISDDPRQPKLPLIRLRILYTEEDQMFSPIRFGQQYNEQVANPIDMILFKRAARKQKFHVKGVDKEAMDIAFDGEDVTTETRVEDIVDRYFETVDESKQLEVFPAKSLSELCRRLVESNDDDAAENIIKFYKETANKFLEEKFPHENEIDNELYKFREKAEQTYNAVLKMLDGRNEIVRKQTSRSSFFDDEKEESDDDAKPTTASRLKNGSDASTSARGATRARGRGSRGGTTRGRGRGAQKAELDVSVNKRTSRQQTLDSMISPKKETAKTARSRGKVVYEVSDSD